MRSLDTEIRYAPILPVSIFTESMCGRLKTATIAIAALLFCLQGCGADKKPVPALSSLLSGFEMSGSDMSEEKAKELVDFVASVPTTIEDLEPYLGVPQVWEEEIRSYQLNNSHVLFVRTDRERYGGLILVAELALLVSATPSGDAVLVENITIHKGRLVTAAALKNTRQ